MYEHDYDENGLPGSYLGLTLVFPIALAVTYGAYKSAFRYPCKCEVCDRLSRRERLGIKRMVKFVLVALLWGCVAYLCYNIRTVKLNLGSKKFDPRELLGVEEGATLSEIKKAYRKKLRQAKRENKTKEEEGDAITKINKAFEIVSKPEEYTNWLNKMIVEKQIFAIPGFILRTQKVSILMYVIFLLLLLPLCIHIFRKKQDGRSPSGALFTSIESFWESISLFSKREELFFPQILVFISKCAEFVEHKWERDLSEIKSVVETKYVLPLLSSSPGYLHIVDYLCRSGLASDKDREYTRKMLYAMASSFWEVSRVCENESLFLNLSLFKKMVLQAVPAPAFAMMQYPNVKPEEVLVRHKGGSNERQLLEKIVQPELLGEALHVYNLVPRIIVKKVEAYVISTNEELYDDTEGELKRENCLEGSEIRLEMGATPTVQLTLEKSNRGISLCHSPYFGSYPEARWTLFYSIDGEMQPGSVTFRDFEGSKSLDFTLKFSTKETSELKVYVCSNGYFGNDLQMTFPIKCHK